jgi:hypothetical protein
MKNPAAETNVTKPWFEVQTPCRRQQTSTTRTDQIWKKTRKRTAHAGGERTTRNYRRDNNTNHYKTKSGRRIRGLQTRLKSRSSCISFTSGCSSVACSLTKRYSGGKNNQAACTHAESKDSKPEPEEPRPWHGKLREKILCEKLQARGQLATKLDLAQTAQNSFDVKPLPNHRPSFWGSTKKLALQVSTCQVQTVYSVTRPVNHPVTEYPTCVTISDSLHQVSYSYHSHHHCTPCRTCQLHTTRQANAILQMNKDKRKIK